MIEVVFNFIVKVSVIIIALIVILYLFCRFYPAIGKVPSKKEKRQYEKKNKLYYDGRFHNIKKTIYEMSKYEDKKAKEIRPQLGVKFLKIDKVDEPSKDRVTITWLGHSSLLIQMDGKNILIDPALTKYASPFSFIGIKRFNESPIDLENIPTIDVLLISHDHYDHLDYRTIKKIESRVKKYIVPLGVESYLRSFGVNDKKIVTLNWWENEKEGEVLFTAIPARHFSMRNPFYRNTTLWCGFLMQYNGKNYYFTGDTGYSETFKEVHDKFGDIEVFMADAGQYNKAWTGIHMNPYGALKAAKDVNAKYYIPVHWGAFALSNHDWFEPANITTSNHKEYGGMVITPKIGEIVDLDIIERYTSRWWEDN